MPVRVVLVDDVDEARRLVRIALRFRSGVRVVGEAATGEEAIAVVARLRPDVVVLDLGLPDLAGEEVLTRIRAVAPATEVVVFTGRAFEDVRWFEKRASAVVTKDQLGRLVDVVASFAVAGSAKMTVEFRLPHDPASPSRARAQTLAAMKSWGLEDVAEPVVLVVSELATNAVEHAHSGFELTLKNSDGVAPSIRVEVADAGPGTPELVAGDQTSERGRGLRIISAVCEVWGVFTAGGRKVVWAEVDASS